MVYDPELGYDPNSSYDPYQGNSAMASQDVNPANTDYAQALQQYQWQNPTTGTTDTSTTSLASWLGSVFGTSKAGAQNASLAGSGISMLGNFLGGSAQRDAANSALSGLQNAYAQAATGAQSQFQTALNLQAPYRQIGASLAPTYETFASGADAGRATLGQLASDQGLYQWTNDELSRNINNQLSSRGMVNSGAGLRTLSDAYQANAANQANQIWSRDTQLENSDYQRLTDAMNLGNGASATGAQSAVGTGTTLANVYSGLGTGTANATNNAGAATASMYTGAANAANSGINNALTSGYWNS